MSIIHYVKHPGLYLQKELDKHNLSFQDFMFMANVSDNTLNSFLTGKIRLTKEIEAASLKYFQLNLRGIQDKYDAQFKSVIQTSKVGYIKSAWDMARRRGMLPETANKDDD